MGKGEEMAKTERIILEEIAHEMGHVAPELLTDKELIDYITMERR